jgi:hypothetical protein
MLDECGGPSVWVLLEGSTGLMPIEGTTVRTVSQSVDVTIVMGRPMTFSTAS